jgi:ferrous iron transport protein A
MVCDGPVQEIELQFARDSKSEPAAIALPQGRVVRGASGGGPISLADLPRGTDATVAEVLAPALPEDGPLVLRLIEIGFVPGEPVRIVAQGFPGREPIAVRLGGTTFALRRFEADYIRVVAGSERRSA